MEPVEPTARLSPDGRPRPGALRCGPGLFRAPVGRTGRVGAVLSVVDRATRGPVAVAVALGVFGLAGGLGGRVGVAVAGGYALFFGGYCLLNLWACREAHCALTGPGFTAVGVLGIVAAAWPGEGLSWYGVNVESIAFLVVLAVGFAFERALVARTGQPTSCC